MNKIKDLYLNQYHLKESRKYWFFYHHQWQHIPYKNCTLDAKLSEIYSKCRIPKKDESLAIQLMLKYNPDCSNLKILRNKVKIRKRLQLVKILTLLPDLNKIIAQYTV